MTVLLENITGELNDLQTPGLSFDNFNLPGFLREGLKRANFSYATPIQAESIPVLLSGKDLIAQSQTGSGKTAAFAIPILARVQRQSSDLQALVMVPTRELALQVTQVFKLLAGTAVRITTIYGGAGMDGQIRGLTRGGYQVVVGTPGRLRDHLNRRTLRLDRLRMVVLDEADEMLDRGFAPDVEAILSEAPPTANRQTALFSATVPEWVGQTAAKHLRPDTTRVTLVAAPESRPDIQHLVYDMNLADKQVALRHLLDTNKDNSMLVFARTKHGVKKLAARLQAEGYAADGLQGNLSQNAREQVMAAFRAGKIRVMVATNVGARGLDVSGVTHVINYDLPESAELFTHRVGRTGRNGASGTAITFLTGEDRLKWREIERAMREREVDVQRQPWPGPRADRNAPEVPARSERYEGEREPSRRFNEPRRAGNGNGNRRTDYNGPRERNERGQEDAFQPAYQKSAPFRPARRFNSNTPEEKAPGNGGWDKPAPRRRENADWDRPQPGNFRQTDSLRETPDRARRNPNERNAPGTDGARRAFKKESPRPRTGFER